MQTDAPASLTEAVYRTMRADLLACRTVPGERLRIAALALRHRASPGAVREALSRLTAEGLVVSEPQRGFHATPISASDLSDLTVARIEVETLCLNLAVSSGDLLWEESLLAASHRLIRTRVRADDDPDRVAELWADAHAVFHEALVAACPNQTLLRVRRHLYAQSERYRRLSVPLAEFERDLDGEHRELTAAALGRDALRAVAAMRRHLNETTRILLGSHAGFRDVAA